MSRAGDKSRIARALREDADEAVRPDVDLWPLIRERVGARRAAAAIQMGADATEAVAGTSGTPRAAQRGGRKPTLHLSLTGALPVLVMVLAMVGAYLAPSGMLSWLAATGGQHDPCRLITQQEADGFVGAHLEQVHWQPARVDSFACAYNGQDESLNLLVARFDSDEHAVLYLNNRLKSIRPLSPSLLLPEDDRAGDLADKVPGVADEAYEATVHSNGGAASYFRHILARQGSTYFIVTWMTGKAEPSSELTTLAHRIAERLRSW